jgi:hypothetical protein
MTTFESWDQLLEEFGNTEEELDELFEQPWPGHPDYREDTEDDEDERADES